LLAQTVADGRRAREKMPRAISDRRGALRTTCAAHSSSANRVTCVASKRARMRRASHFGRARYSKRSEKVLGTTRCRCDSCPLSLSGFEQRRERRSPARARRRRRIRLRDDTAQARARAARGLPFVGGFLGAQTRDDPARFASNVRRNFDLHPRSAPAADGQSERSAIIRSRSIICASALRKFRPRLPNTSRSRPGTKTRGSVPNGARRARHPPLT
jgi:hypothetical protein